MLIWPSALSDHGAGGVSNEPGPQRPRVERSAMESCGSAAQQNYCFNRGQCMLLVDFNEYHCKCEEGYYGPRCAHLDLVFQPMGEEQLALVVVCVVLLIIGLSGVFYFFFKWYKRNRSTRSQKSQGYMGVESA
ncbi:Proepiregulin [Merluccius polli]|uniref:Proepiregulin n=1 Tax=Merluccius polli TaxID=89951 RepID=A0AA47M853_MERPO|nr:Proepiregulin [Merluccius polli]